MKKILLKTLLPLATVGISLGVALPLASCSCGGSNVNTDEVAFSSEDNLINYMIQHIPNPETQNFTQSPYDNTKDNPQMITWVLNHLDTDTILLGLAYTFFAVIIHEVSNPYHIMTNSVDICAINFGAFDVVCQATLDNGGIVYASYHSFKENAGIKLQGQFTVRDSTGTILIDNIYPLNLADIETCNYDTEDGFRYTIFDFEDGTFADGFDMLTFPVNIWTNVFFPSK